MTALLLLLAAAPVLLLASAGHAAPAQTKACEVGADGQCRLPAGSRGGIQKDQVLLQIARDRSEGLSKSGAAAEDAEAVALDEAAALHVRRLWQSPDDIGDALGRGMEAIRSALPSLQQEQPDMNEAMTVLGRNVTEAIRPILPETVQNSEAFRNFAEHCVSELLELGGEEDMQLALTNYTEGELTGLIDILTTALDTVHYVAARDFTRSVAIEIGRYLDSLSDLLQAAGTSMDLIETGEEEQSMGSLSNGTQAAVDELVPEGERSDSKYQQVVKRFEGRLGAFVSDVMQFVRRIISMAVCWKRSAKRETTRPHLCSHGYFLNEHGWCMPVHGRGRAKRAHCQHGQKTWGRWCVAPCKPGYKAFARHCKQECGGAYEINSPLMCGNKRGAIARTLAEIMAKMAIAAVTRSGLFTVCVSSGYLIASSMSTVFIAFEKFFKPFRKPYCKEDLSEV